MSDLPTKDEMSALWRCLEDSALMVAEGRRSGLISDANRVAERARLTKARRAYLKLNKLRKAAKAKP